MTDDLFDWLTRRIEQVGVIGGGALVMWRVVVHPAFKKGKNIAKILEKVEDMNTRLEELSGRMVKIEHEFQENAGSSTRDQLKRVEKKLDQLLGGEK